MWNEAMGKITPAVLEAGEFIRQNFQKIRPGEVETKGENDFVTWVDRESERMIIQAIKNHFPGHRILSEEEGLLADGDQFLWVVDPLDGTTNFIQGLPHFSIAVCLLDDQEIWLAIIYNPLSRELFQAVRGQGQFFKQPADPGHTDSHFGEKLRRDRIPFRTHHLLDKYLGAFHDIFLQSRGMRRWGSAALDLAFVACGRYDFFWEAFLQPWDFLAGSLLVQEAGGQTADFSGNPLSLETASVLASNPKIFLPLMQTIGKHFHNN